MISERESRLEAYMKTFRFGLAVLLLSVLAATPQDGLRGAKRPGPVQIDEFNDRPKAQPKRGGEIVEAVTVSFRSLDPYQDTSATTSESIHGYVEESLVDGDTESWEDTPKLAEKWDIEDIV